MTSQRKETSSFTWFLREVHQTIANLGLFSILLFHTICCYHLLSRFEVETPTLSFLIFEVVHFETTRAVTVAFAAVALDRIRQG